MRLRSGPCIFSPTGVRMPVFSISIRPRMGMVQEFERPGNSSDWFIPEIRSCTEM